MRALRDFRLIAVLLRQVVHAVRHLHARSIAHRDLKPENVLITRDGALKLCDFGMAHDCGDRLRTVCGTPCYMAPELFKRSKDGYDGTRVDVWAMGALAYELMHEGRPAFSAPTMRELVGRIRRGAHNPLRVGLPKVFGKFVNRCAQIDPAARPASDALPIPIVRGAKGPTKNPSPPKKTRAGEDDGGAVVGGTAGDRDQRASVDHGGCQD